MIHPRGKEVLSEIERACRPASEYNGYLFSLYLIYLRRYQIDGSHIPQARHLVTLLEEKPWPAFTSWQEIIQCSKRLKFNPKPRSSLGCPILKIGYILQELGVIGPKADEQGHWIENLLEHFDRETRETLRLFLNTLKRTGRADGTLRLYLISLKHLQLWLDANHPGLSILSLRREPIDAHLSDFFAAHERPHYRYNHCICLRRFYSWALDQKRLLRNPCAHLSIAKPAPQLTVCSEDQIERLRRFLVNPSSDPTDVLLISLALFFGLTTSDLLFATLQPEHDSFAIILERKPKTFHRQTYNRDQILRLPREPRWFHDLQRRFLSRWQAHYDQSVKTFPRQSLILPRHGYYNRPVSREWVRMHIRKATTRAVGTPIPLSVLRKTCGHLHSQSGEASTLSRLGWSPKFSFYYTWLPRLYFQKPAPNVSAPSKS